MKFILFSLIISSAWAQTGEFSSSVANPDLLISTVKEMNIEQAMMGSSEVRECLKKAKYTEGSSNSQTITDAQACFKTALAGKSKEEIQSLSDKLGLQDFNLIKGRTSKEITQYLSDRLYKAMKGVDRDDEKFLNFRSKDRKMVDQRDFFDLYKTQLTKNSLFEINRFCFLDLRIANQASNPEKTFAGHWESFFNDSARDTWNVGRFKDDGQPVFGDGTPATEKADIYRNLSASLGGSSSIPLFAGAPNGQKSKLGQFFEKCLSLINPMCEEYKKQTSGFTGKACLTKDRIRHLEKAIAANEKLGENWDSMAQRKGIRIADIDFYDRGRSNSENSIDSLTNFSSADFLNTENVASDSEDLIKKCEDSSELAECEQLYLEGNFDETKHNIELKATLKNQLELAQIEKIKTDRQNLKEYLKKQGYYELLKKLEDKPETDVQEIITSLEQMFKARKDAMVAEIGSKLSNRQIRNEESTSAGASASGTPTPTQTKIEQNVKDVKSERERLAQVVLFNNIISSHISLSKKEGDTTKDIGRNLNILKSEVRGQELAQVEVEDDLFQNLKAQAGEDSGGSSENFDSIDVGTLFSKIIGDRPGN